MLNGIGILQGVRCFFRDSLSDWWNARPLEKRVPVLCGRDTATSPTILDQMLETLYTIGIFIERYT